MNDLTRELERAAIEVDSSNLGRALYSTDASLYRVVPSAIAFPRSTDEVVEALEICRRLNVPFTTRGAGTSIAGNAIGTGLVIDVSRHLDQVIAIEGETAIVQPGVVQSSLQAAAQKHGLRFGPDPSTSNRCTIGGMIGNNSCGSRALAYGRTSDNVLALDVVTGAGERLSLNDDDIPELRKLVAPNEELIRGSFGTFGRQVTGYAMEQLLPENLNFAKFLVGSEGTLAVTLGATVQLVRDPAFRGLAVLGYSSMPDAADAVTAILPHEPTACEGIDKRIVDAVVKQHGPGRVPELPDGNGWLMVEVVGDSVAEVEHKAAAVIADSGSSATAIVTDPVTVAHLWRIREDGAGLSSRTPDGRPAYGGWEDAAVPPSQLGAYLREFEALMQQHYIEGMPYGHFGDGCIHVRLSFPLTEKGGPAKMRAFLEDAARLVVKYGGSLSGEHGDGRARGELMKFMYSPEVLDLFAQVKNVFDPQGILNPGVLVNPRPVDADLRAPQAPKRNKGLAFAYKHDDGDFSKAVHRCTGVGKCRADTSAAGGVMCPSFLATRDEKDSTRGRARVLEEMINGGLVKEDWRSPEVHEALDLCLSCKGCSTDCPTGIDLATYKSEVLYQSYKGRIRPRSHYFLGWLPKLARFASKTPRLANAMTSVGVFAKLGKWAAGVDQRRSLPKFATQTFRAWFAQRPVVNDNKPVVALFVDTFTNYFSPSVGQAAVAVLEDAGYRVELTKDGLCCGLTWISTGQLDTARSLLQEANDSLSQYADGGIPVVALEPSCTGVLRSDITELVDGSENVANNTKTLAELLKQTPSWKAPDLSGESVVAQPHCHHHAVMGWHTDAALLKQANATVERLGGCCGLAGNFGVEEGHYDVSVAVGEQHLLPAVRNAGPHVTVLADGFSCRTQLEDLTDRRGEHLAELLARHLRSDP